jgi:hypothetical protein
MVAMTMLDAGVQKSLLESGQVRDVRRVEAALHIHQARVGDAVEMPPVLFAVWRKVEKLGCLYPIEVSQVGCILDRGMVSSPPT